MQLTTHTAQQFNLHWCERGVVVWCGVVWCGVVLYLPIYADGVRIRDNRIDEGADSGLPYEGFRWHRGQPLHGAPRGCCL